jgi:hypothetical protein
VPYRTYFSPLQVKNKPHEGVLTPKCILGPFYMVATILPQNIPES